eukprot:SM000076S21835  [mRNA]  locus=s76:451366:453246:- [translate_table: standard]
MELLQQVAGAHGYTKLVLGLCATGLAARSLAAVTKGRGFALPADVQCFDKRHPVPIVLPLRDCLARELVLHCHLARLQTAFVPMLATMAPPNASINSLAHNFVTLLQEDNPSRVHTILRTVLKLKAFPFNQPPGMDAINKDGVAPPPTRGPDVGDVCTCSICSAPLNAKDCIITQADGGTPPGREIEALEEAFRRSTCRSCRHQVLGAGGGGCAKVSGGGIGSLLPPTLQERALAAVSSAAAARHEAVRSQIQEFLLDDGGEDSVK